MGRSQLWPPFSHTTFNITARTDPISTSRPRNLTLLSASRTVLSNMKLTKRRSSPYLPAPSSLWLPDSHHPSPNPTAHPTPLASQSTSSLIPKRLPFRRRGQSAGPELQLRKDDPNLGTDYENRLEAQTHTQTQPHQTGGLESDGNVFGFSSYDDHCRRPVYTRSISVNTEMIGGVDDRKRDSTGRNRYPPNSLAPDRGWGFGRMRKSRQQDLRIVMPERVESLGYVKPLL